MARTGRPRSPAGLLDKCACGQPRASGARNTWCRECKNQWQREYRAGQKRFRPVPPPIKDAEGCLIWQGNKLEAGYGLQTLGGIQGYAHRFAYEREVGPIPADMTIDHLCEKPSCVNVNHMEVVTRAENTRRAAARRILARQGRCLNGHVLEGYLRDGNLHCRICTNEQQNARYLQRKAGVL